MTEETNIISLFFEWQKKHPNFMTPNVLKIQQIGNSIIELSQGLGFEHKKIYGVSKIDFIKGEFKTNLDSCLNKCFQSKRLAEHYFNTFSEMVK